ncbi:MAG: type II toxin-antitoxin system death-on-curing family toxin [Actinobacteria bacterium]|nr:type II toxin-antitoxin system death-on-curing family toxin [Actinomycetota bacterium]
MTEKIDFLTLQDLLEIGSALIPDFRVRDMGLLDSASKRPQTTVFGDDAYPSFSEKAASLIHSLARNHALIDGNKRIAWAAGRIFCLMNGRDLAMSVDSAEVMILGAAQGALDVPEIAEILDSAIH